LFAHGRWFSPGTPASSTTKSGRHDIAEILLKVALNTKNHHQSLHFQLRVTWFVCSMIGGEMCMSVLLKFVWWNCFPPMLKLFLYYCINIQGRVNGRVFVCHR
jgi:hypothetical protein